MSVTVRLRQRVGTATTVGRAVVTEFQEEQITFMARSVAYSAFVSLLPLLLLLLVVATTVGGESMAQSVLAVTERYLTPAGQNTITSSLTQASGQFSFSLLGIATLLWGVLNVFRGLDVAFSALYRQDSPDGLLGQVKDGLVVLGAILLGVVAMVAAGVAAAFLPDLPFVWVLNVLFLLVVLPMYYVFPDVPVSVREVLPGTVTAAVGFAALQALFGLYVSMAGANELYGAIGGIILLVTWLYFGAVVLLLGAALNVVLAGRNRPPAPSESSAAVDSST
jgi:membrane protein